VVSGVALGELTWQPTLLERHRAEPFWMLNIAATWSVDRAHGEQILL
jgi:hypothetical protein